MSGAHPLFDAFLEGLPSRVPDLGMHPLEYVLATTDIPAGVVVECGVYTGGSITKIAHRHMDRRVFGFDSFEGLPESWGRPDLSFEAGAFDMQKNMPRVPANVTLVAGWFDKTLPEFAARVLVSGPGEKIALLHVDCDIYSSTKCVFDTLGPHLAPGAVVVFDELFNYPTYENHEILAFHQFLEAADLDVEWIGKHGRVDLAPARDNGYWDQPAALRLVAKCASSCTA